MLKPGWELSRKKIVNVKNKPRSIIHPCPHGFRVTSQSPPHPPLRLFPPIYYKSWSCYFTGKWKIIPSGVNILGFSGRVRSCLYNKRAQKLSKADVLALKLQKIWRLFFCGHLGPTDCSFVFVVAVFTCNPFFPGLFQYPVIVFVGKKALLLWPEYSINTL